MRRLFPLAALVFIVASCTQNTGGGFTGDPTPSLAPPAAPARLDLAALTALRARAAAAMMIHLPAGSLDVAWGSGTPAALAGPYPDVPPEADALAAQALRSLAQTPAAGVRVSAAQVAATAAATADAFKQAQGPRGGGFLLLVDAAHPVPTRSPLPADPTPVSCTTPGPGQAHPECLRRQVSDGLLAAWYAVDTKRFFQVGETSMVYRPVDAIALGCALVVAGFQLHDDKKIEAGTNIVQKELPADIDDHYGMLAGLVTATAQGGHDVTDHNTRLADQAGAAEALLEAFDASREQRYMAFAQRLLQPILEEKVALRAPSGGYITGFDLQSSGPPDHGPADVEATLLVLQAARHFDRDDGGRFSPLEETAAGALPAAVEADRKQGGDPAAGVPAVVPETGAALRSGITTALAVVVLGDVLTDLSPSPAPKPESVDPG